MERELQSDVKYDFYFDSDTLENSGSGGQSGVSFSPLLTCLYIQCSPSWFLSQSLISAQFVRDVARPLIVMEMGAEGARKVSRCQFSSAGKLRLRASPGLRRTHAPECTTSTLTTRFRRLNQVHLGPTWRCRGTNCPRRHTMYKGGGPGVALKDMRPPYSYCPGIAARA
ncbi:hypothetical protein RRG08_026097 [Elysia crispata]|uniref:Uncharacterized protein n=1 Tax=Elysia crispata TaxID=231223 RepID=A0AAE0YRL8_9GAST|nr:hypothetical protein RRG08_026097 [Elysia crispata]